MIALEIYTTIGAGLLLVTIGAAFGCIPGIEMEEAAAVEVRDCVAHGGLLAMAGFILVVILWPYPVIRKWMS